MWVVNPPMALVSPATTARPVAVVVRAVAVLDVLAESPRDLGTNEIARRTGMNASSASRMLATLAAGHLVRRAPDTGRYGLGLRLVQLGNAALARVELRDLVRPHLVALMEATGETATLSVPGEDTMMTVDFAQSPSSVRSVAQIGRPSVGHATAIGKVHLAYGGALPDGDLQAFTERTVTHRDELARTVASVRERGYAEALEERETGLNAIAAPVLAGSGELAAVLGLQGPAWRFDTAAMAAAIIHLRQHAGQLSAGSAS